MDPVDHVQAHTPRPGKQNVWLSCSSSSSPAGRCLCSSEVLFPANTVGTLNKTMIFFFWGGFPSVLPYPPCKLKMLFSNSQPQYQQLYPAAGRPSHKKWESYFLVPLSARWRPQSRQVQTTNRKGGSPTTCSGN